MPAEAFELKLVCLPLPQAPHVQYSFRNKREGWGPGVWGWGLGGEKGKRALLK